MNFSDIKLRRVCIKCSRTYGCIVYGKVLLCNSCPFKPDCTINSFKTDRGLIYIEPQLDVEVEVQVGGYYWSDNGLGMGRDCIKEIITW